jgi:hypothetical protein
LLTIAGEITERKIAMSSKADITEPDAVKDEVPVITKKRSKKSKKDKYRNLLFLGGLKSQGSNEEIGANKFNTNTQDLAAYVTPEHNTPKHNPNVETINYAESSFGKDARNLDISDKSR